jgi:hypothetical protein
LTTTTTLAVWPGCPLNCALAKLHTTDPPPAGIDVPAPQPVSAVMAVLAAPPVMVAVTELITIELSGGGVGLTALGFVIAKLPLIVKAEVDAITDRVEVIVYVTSCLRPF